MPVRGRSIGALLVVWAALTTASCANQVTPTGPDKDALSASATSTPAEAAPDRDATTLVPALVDPAGFQYTSGGQAGYFFTTPSGLWRCAILTASAQSGADTQMAGCQPKTSTDIDVEDAPLVADHGSDNLVRPNAILVNRTDDPRFARLSQALFWRTDGTTPVLPYGQTLSTDGFSCNVQETGVSCRSDTSTRGFSFSTHGFDYRYVEALAPQAQPTPTSNVPQRSEPVLGRVWGPSQNGYGEVRPETVYNGGSASGSVSNIEWQNWGGEQANGTGLALNVTSASSVAAASAEKATVVAFDLGDCEGTWMYRSLVWFFPHSGETFESAQENSINSCEVSAYNEAPTNSGGSTGGSCGTVTAEDGKARDVLIKSGGSTCVEAMKMMQATYPMLYDKPLDGTTYGDWNCGIVPAGEVLFTCNNPAQNGIVLIYRSADDPYR